MNFSRKFTCSFLIALYILFIFISNVCYAEGVAVFDSENISSNSTLSTDASSYSPFGLNNAPITYSEACLLMEQSSGEILYSKNIYERMYPASTTKIMTAILALENCKLTDVATASHNAVFSVPVGYSHANIQEGEELTIEQLLNVLLIPSANDAAFVIAEHIAGSVEAFSDMMNEKAKEIGCLNTHFVNPNGIHNENHYSTAYDMALIGRYAMKFDVFRQIVSKTSYALPATNKYDKTDRLFNTTNELLKPNYTSSPSNYYYQYATGAKTGYTDAAANCIVATATKNDVSLIVVILHGERTDAGLSERALDCKSLFEYGFNNFSFQNLASKDSVCQTTDIPFATESTKSLNLVYQEDITAYLPNDFDISSIVPTISVSSDISAPLAKDTILGTVSYKIGNLTYTSNIVSENDVYKSENSKTIMEILLIILILIAIAYFLKLKNTHIRTKSRKKRKNKKSKKNTSLDNFYPKYK